MTQWQWNTLHFITFCICSVKKCLKDGRIIVTLQTKTTKKIIHTKSLIAFIMAHWSTYSLVLALYMESLISLSLGWHYGTWLWLRLHVTGVVTGVLFGSLWYLMQLCYIWRVRFCFYTCVCFFVLQNSPCFFLCCSFLNVFIKSFSMKHREPFWFTVFSQKIYTRKKKIMWSYIAHSRLLLWLKILGVIIP